LNYIDTQVGLEEFVARAANSSVLAIDTEFLREKTYYPWLCLLQMATDTEVVIVDPFCMTDLSVLRELFQNEAIMKIFHAAGQDLEILLKEVGCLPWPVFDTQVAAALLGQSHQIGFGAAVSTFCGVSIKKMDSFTDWSRRPLTSSQLGYAADDVIYLPDLYETMKSQLEEKGRLRWLDADFKDLVREDRYIIDPRTRFRRLKRGNQLSRKQLSAAREITAWREMQAQRRDIPRKWVLSDEQIVELCKREPATIDDMFMVRGIREKITTAEAREILKLVKHAFALPENEWPELDKPGHTEENVDLALDLMEALVRLRARENDIAVQTLATHSDMTLLARGYEDESGVMKGWRRQLIGNELKELLDGKIKLSLKNNNLVVIKNSAKKSN
jgi:ribonuclease D